MDWGSPSCLLESRLLLLQLLTILLVMAGRCEACRVEQCSSEYGDHQNLQDFQASPESCRLAHAYMRCLRDTARQCRGDINFHFAHSWLEKKITQNNCTALLRAAAAAAMTPPTSTSAPATTTTTSPTTTTPAPAPPPHCVWKGRRRFRHCGLFGDPHLKTFDNEYQTCRVRGAWPLIDNPYLAVQVTNEPVVEGSPATATTKVTVIVRGGKNTSCTPEKTYEAQSDAPLPSVFIDGTRQSGPDQVVLLTTHDDGARIEISALHIASRVVVRRSKHYLSLAAQLPEELALSASSAPTVGLQLCARGCPASERLDADPAAAVDAAASALPYEAAVARCRRSSSALNLSFPYLEWCVFDVMTTAADEFVAAAQSAQEDVVRLDPGSLNGTAPGFEPEASTSSSSSPTARFWTLLLALLAMVAASS